MMGDTRVEPNNGLLVIGNGLRCDGHDVSYFDLNEREYRHFKNTGRFYSKKEMFSLIAEKAEDFDFVFFSAIIVGIDDALQAITHLKNKFPEKIVVLGGTFPSMCPEYCIRNSSGIDVLVVGEGEGISSRIVDAYATKRFSALDGEKGIFYRRTPSQGYECHEGFNLVDIKESGLRSMPDWTLLDSDFGEHRVYRLMTARGCGFRCSFCVPSKLSGHMVRKFDRTVVLDTIKRIKYEHRAESYVIGDLTFFFETDEGENTLKSIAEEGIHLPFWCQTHLSRVNEERVRLLSEAGCSQLAVGLETLNPKVLKSIAKGFKPTNVSEKLALIKKYGIEVQAYFIIGLPGDDVHALQYNSRFIRSAIKDGLIDRTHIGIYVPYPGMPVEDGAVVESRDYRYYTQGVFEDIPAYPVYSSRTLSQAQIYQAYVRCLGEVGEALDMSTTLQASNGRLT